MHLEIKTAEVVNVETANLTDNPFSVNLIFREISSEGGKFLRSRKMLERKKTVFIPFFREIISERNTFASFTEIL